MEEKEKNNDATQPKSDSDELSECRTKCDEYLNGWKRAKADFVNYQKEEMKRLDEMTKFGNQKLIKDLLVVLDGFDLAIIAMGDKVEKGMYMIRAQLEDRLKQAGLTRIVVEIGMAFDPGKQEAMLEVESEKYPPGTTIEELERGYALHGRVIRPAKVKIVKAATESAQE